MFIPTTAQEVKDLGWQQLDVILISGDSYIDSPYIGAALIGKVLLNAGYKVGIIAQPDINSPDDITRLGEARLFWGVTAGSLDSMVANTTALGKPRRSDDYTPGGVNNRRPNRASIVYANLIRRYFKQTSPIVMGGVEASLRRVAHYDFWSDRIRRAILFDAKANYLLYGMAEKTVLALAKTLARQEDPCALPGLCYISKEAPSDYLELPSYEAVVSDKQSFIEMFHLFYRNNDPLTARGLCQLHKDRYLVQNPPAPYMSQAELDAVYALDFEHDLHPYYAAQGKVRALETIRFAIPTHRGCYGECNFCSISVHEGRTVRWRSQESILNEARQMTHRPGFKGIIQDLSGPTANMYGFECHVKLTRGACPDKGCLYPEICPLLGITHAPQTELLKSLRKIEGVRKAFVGSGLRHDMVLADVNYGDAYLQELVEHHVSGQLKLAPEHTQAHILKRMGKPGTNTLLAFKKRFDSLSKSVRKRQFLTYYLIAAYPGCNDRDMKQLKLFASQKLNLIPEQVQVFTPTPSTYASLMYYTEMDPFTGEKLFVEKNPSRKSHQKWLVTGRSRVRKNKTPSPGKFKK